MEDRREFSGFTPLLVIGVMILAANGFLCYMFYARKRLRRKPENALFFSQACADLMNGVIIIPVYILDDMEIITDVMEFLVVYTVFVSLFGLLAITIDRYLGITRPMWRRAHFTIRSLSTELSIVWLVPLLFSMLNLVYILHPTAEMLHRALHCALVIINSICYSIIILLHLVTYIKARNNKRTKPSVDIEPNITDKRENVSDKEVEDHELKVMHLKELESGSETNGLVTTKCLSIEEEMKLIKFTLILFVFYLIGHVPTIYLNFLLSIGRNDLVTASLTDLSLYSFLLNSVFNPVLCLLIKRDFKEEIITLFSRQRNETL